MPYKQLNQRHQVLKKMQGLQLALLYMYAPWVTAKCFRVAAGPTNDCLYGKDRFAVPSLGEVLTHV